MIVFIAAPIMTILGASSRGAQLALLVVLALMYRKHVFRIKPMVAVACVLVAAFYLLPEQQKERFNQIGEDRTSQQRLLYLQNGWEMMKKYPVFGVGYFNFPSYFALHYPEDIITYNDQAELAHNIFIQVGTDAGFVGLALFIGIILSGLRLAFRIRCRGPDDEIFRYIGAGLGYGLIGFVIAGQFVTVAYYPFLWIGVAFVAALNNIVSRAPEALQGKGPVFAPRQSLGSVNKGEFYGCDKQQIENSVDLSSDSLSAQGGRADAQQLSCNGAGAGASGGLAGPESEPASAILLPERGRWHSSSAGGFGG